MANETVLHAGRELDALVAERVMGWTRVRNEPAVYPTKSEHSSGQVIIAPRGWMNPDGDVLHGQRPGTEPDDNYAIADIPHYSTRIGAAWQVLEKMREMGWQITLHCAESPVRPSDWAPFVATPFRLEPEPNPDREIAVMHNRNPGVGDTAPEAICRAALKTVGQ